MSENTDKVMMSIKTLREEVESRLPDQAKMDAINVYLDGAEAAGQKALAEQQEIRQESEELKERLNGLEVELSRKGGAGQGKNFKDSDEYKAMNSWMQEGESQEAKAALRTDIDAQGGYLVPQEMDDSITKKITEISAIRQIARVRTIASKSMEMPVRATIPEATFEGEAEEGDESNSTYESETVTAFRLTYTAPITQDMLMNAAFDMESEISSDAAEAFAQKEGNKFVLGTGHKQPQGFLSDSRITDLALQSC